MVNITKSDYLFLKDSINNIVENISAKTIFKLAKQGDFDSYKEFISNIENRNWTFDQFILDEYETFMYGFNNKKLYYIGETEEETYKFKAIFERNKKLFNDCYSVEDFTRKINSFYNNTEEDWIQWSQDNKKTMEKNIKELINKNIISSNEIETLKKISFERYKTAEDLIDEILFKEDIDQFVDRIKDNQHLIYIDIYTDMKNTYFNKHYTKIYNTYVRTLFEFNIEEAGILFKALKHLLDEMYRMELYIGIEDSYILEDQFIKIFYEVLNKIELELLEMNRANFIYEAFGWLYSMTGEEIYSLELYKYLEELINDKGISKLSLARMIYFGNIKNWDDDYFYIDENGNISSMSEFDFKKLMKDNEKNVIKELEKIINDIESEYNETKDELMDFYRRNYNLIYFIKKEWF